MTPGALQLTELIRQMQAGDRTAAEEVFANAATRLRGMSRSLLAKEGCVSGSFQASDLVQEAYAQKLARLDSAVPLRDREHFFALIARGMRQILIDRGRTRKTAKRERPELHTGPANPGSNAVQQNLSAALRKLEQFDPSAYRVLRLKTDHGLTWEEIASKAGITVAQARGEYAHAIAWLREQIA